MLGHPTDQEFLGMVCSGMILNCPVIPTVGRRGTNQLRLLERYLDVLVKHTTEIPPPTALVEETAPSALVEDVSLG